MWYAKESAVYEQASMGSTDLLITRVPATGKDPPCLRLDHRTAITGGSEKAAMEFIRLSMPVRCKEVFEVDKLVKHIDNAF